MAEQALQSTAQTGDDEPRPGAAALIALVILSTIVGLNTVDRGMFSLLLPQIQADIALSDTELGFLMGPAFVIVYSVAGVPIAWLADRTGRRNVIAIGLAFWSAVTAVTGAAQNYVHLIATRMALGVGEASNMAPTSALIGDMFRGRWRVMAMSVFSAGGPLAIMIFYPLIGWIAATYGWRPTYPVMGLIGLTVALLTLFLVTEPRRDAREEKSVNAESFLKVSINILKSKIFLLLCASGIAIGVNYSAMVYWTPAFLARVHGLDPEATGAMLGLYKGLVGVAATLAAGVLVTILMQFNRRWLAWAPMLFTLGIIPAQLMLLLADGPVWWHIGLGLETVFMQGITPCLFALLITLLAPRTRATGAALYLLLFNFIGQSVGPFLAGALTDGPFAVYGDEAIRYSLLCAPLFAVGCAVALFLLSFSMQSGEEKPA